MRDTHPIQCCIHLEVKPYDVETVLPYFTTVVKDDILASRKSPHQTKSVILKRRLTVPQLYAPGWMVAVRVMVRDRSSLAIKHW